MNDRYEENLKWSQQIVNPSLLLDAIKNPDNSKSFIDFTYSDDIDPRVKEVLDSLVKKCSD